MDFSVYLNKQKPKVATFRKICLWYFGAVILVYSEHSNKVKTSSITMIHVFPFFFPLFLESPPAAMSRNGYFFEESGKYHLTYLLMYHLIGRGARNLKRVIQNSCSLRSTRMQACMVVVQSSTGSRLCDSAFLYPVDVLDIQISK